MKTLSFALLLLNFPLLIFGQDSIARDQVFPLLTTIHDTIVYHHPIGYDVEKRADLAKSLEEIKSGLKAHFAARPGDSMAVPDFIFQAGELQRASGCGHLQLRPVLDTATLSVQRRHARYFGLYPIEDGSRYVLNDSTRMMNGEVLKSGTEVIRLEGRPISELVEYLSAFQGLNDLGFMRGANYKISSSLWAYYQNYYGYRDSLAFTILDPETSEERTVWLDTKSPNKKRARTPKKERHKAFFSLRKSKDSSAWVLRVRSFGGYAYAHVNTQKLLKKTFKTIRESGVDKLILDVRSNGGGSLERANKFCRYLAKEDYRFTENMYSETPTAPGTNIWNKMGYFLVGGVRKKDGHFEQPGKVKMQRTRKDAFKGELVVIVNEMSFSATVMLAHVLKETGSAQVIGAETGGSRKYTYGGNIRTYTIGDDPKFRLTIPNWRFEQYRSGEGTFVPHEIVQLTQEKLLEGGDARMERALEILSGK